jgi:hypothetical protein
VLTKEIVAQNVLADTITAKNICAVDATGAKTCINKAQLDALLAAATVATTPTATPTPTPTATSTATSTPPTTSTSTAPVVSDVEPPVITILGSNPASVNVGDVYADLGATVTDNVDQNLGIKASVDGGAQIDLSAISIDTSVAGAHSIMYVATDSAGNIGTNTRTVDVVATTGTATSTTP